MTEPDAPRTAGLDDPPALTVVPPGGGPTRPLGSIGVQFTLWGSQTNGSVAVVEHPLAVGALVPPHLHTREDEYSIVTDGEIAFRSGEREVVLGAALAARYGLELGQPDWLADVVARYGLRDPRV